MKYLLLLIFLLAGCSKYSGPYRICLEDHTETYIVNVLVGKIMVPQLRTRVVCDKYTVQEYIKIDKVVYEVQKVYEEKN